MAPFLAAMAGSSATALSTARSMASGGDERPNVGEVECRIAPVDEVEAAEAMLLDRVDFLVAERGAFIAAEAKRTEGAVALVAPCPPGDLGHFGDGQSALAVAVELLEAGERDVGDVHVEAHADGIGRDEIVDLSALEHGDLGVAGRGRQCTHDDRSAAAETAEHFGEGVDLLGREGDDGGARGQPGQLDVASIAKGREAWTADDFRLGQQLADNRLQGIRAKDQRLLAAARAEHAVGENVAALRIDAELRFVDCGEGELVGERPFARPVVAAGLHGHRFGGGKDVARLWRDDPFLAGQERDLRLALDGDDPVTDLARKQSQREADHARRMRAHAFDREVGLARVGRAKDRPNGCV